MASALYVAEVAEVGLEALATRQEIRVITTEVTAGTVFKSTFLAPIRITAEVAGVLDLVLDTVAPVAKAGVALQEARHPWQARQTLAVVVEAETLEVQAVPVSSSSYKSATCNDQSCATDYYHDGSDSSRVRPARQNARHREPVLMP